MIATRLADALGCDAEETRRVYYLALLRHIGCTAGSHEFAALVGDELEFHHGLEGADFSQGQMLRHLVRTVTRDEPPLGKVRALVRLAASAKQMKEGSIAICEVAGRLAGELGFGPDLQREIGEVYERWDGKGLARGSSLKEIARELVIAPKTADAHVQHIYAKAGVSTRAAATLFAAQHDLLETL